MLTNTGSKQAVTNDEHAATGVHSRYCEPSLAPASEGRHLDRLTNTLFYLMCVLSFV